MDTEVLLTAKGISKRFGLTQALDDVSITIRRGEVKGLIGENGSGKSTFSSIISGVHVPDSAQMYLKDKKYEPSDMLYAQENGISMIVQEMGTIPGTKVADNIFLGKEHFFSRFGVVDRKGMYKAAQKVLDLLGIEGINPSSPVTRYGLEERKLIEIVRAVYNNPEIFIVDETTTALSHKGREILYNLIKKFQRENKAVFFISHDLEELMDVCNSLTILRDGKVVATLEKDEFEEEKIKELMVGRKLAGDYYRSDYDSSHDSEIVLKAEHLYLDNKVIYDLSFELHKGEILGIGGLSNSGMHELGKMLFGIKKSLSGKVYVNQNKEIKSSSAAIKNKIGYISKNRDLEALVLEASILDNTVMPSYTMLSKYGLLFRRKEKKFTNEQIEALNIKCTGPLQEVKDLSGGNKQKVVIGKWLGNKTEVFIMDCPTRGIDIGVKAAIYRLMANLKKQGKSIIMISEELPELIGMSDRMLLLKRGRLVKQINRSPSLSEHMLIKEMI